MLRLMQLSLLAITAICANGPKGHASGCLEGDAEPTWSKLLHDADLVAICDVAFRPNGIEGKNHGFTEFVVRKALAGGGVAKGQVILAPDRYESMGEPFVVMFEKNKQVFAPTAGIQLGKSGESLAYIESLIKLRVSLDRSKVEFFAAHLSNSEFDVKFDAWRSLAAMPRAKLASCMEKCDASPFVRFIEQSKDDSDWQSVPLLCLGLSGDKKHLPVLRTAARNQKKSGTATHEKVWYGYLSLSPSDAMDDAIKALSDKNVPFEVRYAAFLAVQTMTSDRPDLVSRDKATAIATKVLACDDMSDLGVEMLRRWKRFEITPQVLNLVRDRETVRRAVLRFALESPHPAAHHYVVVERRLHPAYVADVAEQLRIANIMDAAAQKRPEIHDARPMPLKKAN